MNNYTQPLNGIILGRQIKRNVFLLLIAATGTKAKSLPQVLQVLSKSLKAV